MVTGATVEVRQAARARRAARSRVQHFGARIKTAPTAARRLAEAFDYLRAVGAGLPDEEKDAWVQVLTDLADGRNKR